MAKKPDSDAGVISDVLRLERGEITCYVIGRTPLIYNKPSEKARQELLLPHGKKTTLEKQTTLKHDPLAEYRGSVYRSLDDNTPALLYHLASAFKGAIATAALDIPGAKKAQIGRLVWVEGDHVPIFGTPQLLMAIVKSSGIDRTPDVRTRAILPQWACKLTVSHIEQLIKPQAVANLLGAGGLTVGVGDYRAEKGKGNYGQFELTSPDDARWQAIVEQQGREAQTAALRDPTCYDDETERLLSWYEAELVRRETAGRIAKGATKRRGEAGDLAAPVHGGMA